MSTTINTNLASLNVQRNLTLSTGGLSTAVQRLSSGMRVNSARDDAAGLAIAERMNAQVRGMNVAVRNATDAVSLAQTAEGALGKVSDSLQRMRELAVQSANATNNTGDRANLNTEFQQLADEIDRTLAGSTFNGIAILATAGTQTFQVGAGNTTNDRVDLATTNLTTDATITAVTGAASDITTATNAGTAITNIDAAINTITTTRATYGALQNRFEASIGLLKVMSENNAAARGRIVDADYAAETAALSRAQVLQQAGTAMLAQANQLPNSVLKLLQ
jgi:flagellin